MFATQAQAQTPGGAPAGGGVQDMIQMIGLPVMLFVLFYVLIIRPQQRRTKQLQAMIGGLKRGDTIVLNSGVIGKVTRIDDAEASVEIAPSTTIKVVKSMIAEVRTRGEPAPANDAKTVS